MHESRYPVVFYDVADVQAEFNVRKHSGLAVVFGSYFHLVRIGTAFAGQSFGGRDLSVGRIYVQITFTGKEY